MRVVGALTVASAVPILLFGALDFIAPWQAVMIAAVAIVLGMALCVGGS